MPLSSTFEKVRQPDLRPFSEIHSRLPRGSLKRPDGKTHPMARDAGADAASHAGCAAVACVPPGQGLLFAQQAVRAQFAGLWPEAASTRSATVSHCCGIVAVT